MATVLGELAEFARDLIRTARGTKRGAERARSVAWSETEAQHGISGAGNPPARRGRQILADIART
jgi:hypothetical protein